MDMNKMTDYSNGLALVSISDENYTINPDMDIVHVPTGNVIAHIFRSGLWGNSVLGVSENGTYVRNCISGELKFHTDDVHIRDLLFPDGNPSKRKQLDE